VLVPNETHHPELWVLDADEKVAEELGILLPEWSVRSFCSGRNLRHVCQGPRVRLPDAVVVDANMLDAAGDPSPEEAARALRLLHSLGYRGTVIFYLAKVGTRVPVLDGLQYLVLSKLEVSPGHIAKLLASARYRGTSAGASETSPTPGARNERGGGL
jgi:hypothetical protein